MSYGMRLALFVACLGLFTMESALALDLPGVKREKKKEKKEEKKEEPKAAESKPAESKPAESKAEAKEEPAAAPAAETQKEPAADHAAAAEETSIDYGAEMWEKKWKTSKVGDYCVYEMAGSKQRQEVVEVGDRFVVVKTTQEAGGQNFSSKQRFTFLGTNKTSKDKMTVAGKSINVEKTETIENGKVSTTMINSDDVPLNGQVSMEHAGQTIMKLTDFGRGK